MTAHSDHNSSAYSHPLSHDDEHFTVAASSPSDVTSHEDTPKHQSPNNGSPSEDPPQYTDCQDTSRPSRIDGLLLVSCDVDSTEIFEEPKRIFGIKISSGKVPTGVSTFTPRFRTRSLIHSLGTKYFDEEEGIPQQMYDHDMQPRTARSEEQDAVAANLRKMTEKVLSATKPQSTNVLWSKVIPGGTFDDLSGHCDEEALKTLGWDYDLASDPVSFSSGCSPS
ncbi:hypothetical protein BD324DRAFT_635878 [Kockovaella imperatae]|uniref:Uncharacterized protein n=1 Tax=Kockovaella imperatae TaxID=4999 RepID=A0A1Y1UA93_9TREE|nr:hypothetical protein BD324DRAFT_635878 [Kockovaella imperatae]ORX34426.1 hypothetical protein BD324DRAFT_635878 [Kockovaella imperatae]